jgi:hypothetical protein
VLSIPLPASPLPNPSSVCGVRSPALLATRHQNSKQAPGRYIAPVKAGVGTIQIAIAIRYRYRYRKRPRISRAVLALAGADPDSELRSEPCLFSVSGNVERATFSTWRCSPWRGAWATFFATRVVSGPASRRSRDAAWQHSSVLSGFEECCRALCGSHQRS